MSRYWRLLKIRDFVQKYITEICECYITLNYISFNEMSKKDLTCDVFHCVLVYACCFAVTPFITGGCNLQVAGQNLNYTRQSTLN